MRILMLNNEFPPLGGGTATVNLELLKRFAGQGLEMDLVTSSPVNKHEEEQFAPTVRIYKVPVGIPCLHHATNVQLVRYALGGLKVARALQRKRNYSLCFAWCTLPAGAMALALRRVTGLPYLVRLSGPDIPGFEQRYESVLRVLGPLVRAVWNQADRVVAKSLNESELMKRAAPSVALTTIRNGVALSDFRPARVSSHNPPRLLCVGRLIKRKGQALLFQALKALKDEGVFVELTLVGEGDEEEAYRQQVRRLGIESQVIFSGYVPRAQMPDFYERADLFVLPSFHEGMSVAALEAMAAGLPLVLSDAADRNELLREGTNGFRMRPGDVQCLTRILRSAATQRGLLPPLASGSRAMAQEFSWEQVVEKYVELFRSLGDCQGAQE